MSFELAFECESVSAVDAGCLSWSLEARTWRIDSSERVSAAVGEVIVTAAFGVEYDGGAVTAEVVGETTGRGSVVPCQQRANAAKQDRTRYHVPQNGGFSERWSVTRDSFTPPDVPENLFCHHGLGGENPYGSGVADIEPRCGSWRERGSSQAAERGENNQ